MNQQLAKLIDRVIELSNDESIRLDIKRDLIKICVQGYATDILNAFDDIEKTSLNAEDKKQRKEQLCTKFSLFKINDKYC